MAKVETLQLKCGCWILYDYDTLYEKMPCGEHSTGVIRPPAKKLVQRGFYITLFTLAAVLFILIRYGVRL